MIYDIRNYGTEKLLIRKLFRRQLMNAIETAEEGF